ncbi:hypothetical protein H257_00584 [Aphanomyces astaci]|uniref:DDE-1 domain-containing protein n=1 Tax=Aphanomyces astaci TaxID=112090 RepID=W4HDL7_APHAT|nr:hypothetical protein H257_00584 [Aphanomyces astaci]ETV89228.1 hypothetical protein H257_00584 [Aphanomyces astaci]|eukprot:XP_009821628.1 hypothetical protein H257_00584 [Aphanomyces astaci]
MTAVLTVRANGDKLPILFVIRGAPGGRIETSELPLFPRGHVYAVQQKGWMDNTVWNITCGRCLQTTCPTTPLSYSTTSRLMSTMTPTVLFTRSWVACFVPFPPKPRHFVSHLVTVFGVMAPFKR